MIGNIYILKSFGENNSFIYKLGYSSNVKERFKEYKLSNPFVKPIAIIDVEYPDKWEHSFHKIYKSDYKNEWYLEETLINILKSGIYFKELKLINDSNINNYLEESYNKSKLLSPDEIMSEILKYIFYNYKTKKYYPELNLTIGKPELNPKLINYSIREVESVIRGIDWIINKLEDKEYTFLELEKMFSDEFLKRNLIFNGHTLKDYFPPFEKTRKVKNKIKETYYKFNV